MTEVSNSPPELFGMEYAHKKKWTFMNLALGQFISGLIIIGFGIADFISTGGTSGAYYSMVYISTTSMVIQRLFNVIAGSWIVIFSVFGLVQAVHTTSCTIVTNVSMSWFGIPTGFVGMSREFSLVLSPNNSRHVHLVACIFYIVAFVLFMVSCTLASKANGCCCYSARKQPRVVFVQYSLPVQPHAQPLLNATVFNDGLQRNICGNGNYQPTMTNVDPWERQETNNVQQPRENKHAIYSMPANQMPLYTPSAYVQSGL